MIIEKLLLKNFGIYESKEFLFQRISVLLDRNGAGKSTVLKALNFALDGDFEDGMVRDGENEMSVSVRFGTGLVVQRQVKNGRVTHRMGYDKLKAATKEAVNSAVAAMTGTTMDKLRVIASSSDLFKMKPEELAKFFMGNIPNMMTADKVISYLDDVNPDMEKKVRYILPQGEFSQEAIDTAYKELFNERTILARDIKSDKSKIMGYDFEISIRSSGIIQEELTEVLKRIGELESYAVQKKQWEKLKEQRQETLDTLHTIQQEYQAIVVPDIPQDVEKRKAYRVQLEQTIDLLTEQITELKQNIASVESMIVNTKQIILKLQEGFCPQLHGMKCPNDWSGKIHEFESSLLKLKENSASCKKKKDEKQNELSAAKAKLQDFDAQCHLLERKQALMSKFIDLRPTLQELPEEPKTVDMDSVLNRKSSLEEELKIALRHEQLTSVKNGLPVKEKVYDVLDRLVSAFSPKGEVLEKNLKYYLSFFEEQINAKAKELGYQIVLKSQNGLMIKIGKTGKPAVKLDHASGGEKGIALFLLLDLLNSITGINLIFLDEIEILDREVLEKLMELVTGKLDHYDHIVIAGVNHSDTIDVMKEYLYR